MIPEQAAEKARLELREKLRQMMIAWGQEAQKAGMDERFSSGIVAEECMHMSAYFVVRGLGWNLETFLEKCGEVYDIHRGLLAREKQRKAELN